MATTKTTRKATRRVRRNASDTAYNVDCFGVFDALERAEERCHDFLEKYPDADVARAAVRSEGADPKGHKFAQFLELVRWVEMSLRLMIADVNSYPLLLARPGWREHFDAVLAANADRPAEELVDLLPHPREPLPT